ncbi:MAG: ABC transporter substrate-binding protein [Hyphomicrobiales bacterium]|uniref:ABC transporter substrate-binding protein n=1 Tax=Shimia thalassica TaxID=1715693 RepID=UPI0032999586
MNDPFIKDSIEILADKARKGRISRRQFTQLAAGFLGTTALATTGMPVMAADGQLVFVNWGGDAMTAFDTTMGAPFTEATGVKVLQDGSGPTEGAMKAQAESGSPSWDICDADPFSAQALGRQDLMEEIDYDVVDPAKSREGFGWKYAASTYFFSYVIAYDSTQFDTPPTSMADFFDVDKFPGKRAMYKWGAGMWEALLLGDGVARDDLYPLDLDRAHAKLEGFKENVVAFWGGGAESQSLMLNGDASMALIWSTRAKILEEDSEGDIKFIWDDGLISPGSMAVIKGNPAGRDVAMQYIAAAQDPEKQLKMFELVGQGPSNPAADALVPEELKRFSPVDPANFPKQAALDMGWYEENYGAALDAYLGIVSA